MKGLHISLVNPQKHNPTLNIVAETPNINKKNLHLQNLASNFISISIYEIQKSIYPGFYG